MIYKRFIRVGKIFCLAAISFCSLAANARQQSNTLISSGFGQNDCTGNPRFRIIGDMLYAPGLDGIMRRANGSDADWEPFALQGNSVVNFAISGDDIMAIVIPEREWDLITLGMDMSVDARLVKCRLDGSELKDITTPEMEDPYASYPQTYLVAMAQHPTDSNTILLGGYNGNYITHDFGETWEQCQICPLHNSHSFIGWHPEKPNLMFIASELMIMSAYVARSTDEGMTWDFFNPDTSGDSCCHQIAFDPNNPDHLLVGGEGKIYESFDCGENWTTVYDDNNGHSIGYVYNVMYDPDDSTGQTVYVAGCSALNAFRGILKSNDNGATWNQVMKVDTEDGKTLFFDSILFDGKIWFYDKFDIVSFDVSGSASIESVEDISYGKVFYDLNGRKMNRKPHSGIYIKDGKKRMSGKSLIF